MSCRVKAEGGPRKLRFVAKDEAKEKWLDSKSEEIESGDWIPLAFHLWIDPTRDFLFRIDEEDVKGVPTKLLIQDLTITDESA